MTIVEYYIDDGYSGTNFDRPAIKKLMEDIVDEKVNAVIVKDLSRLGRNHIYVDFLLEEIFPKHKIIHILELKNVANIQLIEQNFMIML